MPRKKIIQDDKSFYDREKENNEVVFNNLLKQLRPDVFVLMDLLDTTGVNYLVVFKIIRQLNNIAIGDKYGKVVAEIENGVCTFVRGEGSDKVAESVLVQKDNKIRPI